jgi:hypothetical protein
VIKRLALAAALVLTVALPLHADFRTIANAIDAQHGVHRVWIPFLGLARTIVRVVDPEGVHDFQLAVFEGRGKLTPEELRDLMARNVDKGFRPLVQTYSKRSGEWSFIYARPSRTANRFELIILNAEKDETVLVRVDVDANVLARELDHPIEVSKMARR